MVVGVSLALMCSEVKHCGVASVVPNFPSLRPSLKTELTGYKK